MPAEPAAGPRLDRSVTLHFRGDWGGANLHRVCGWLAQELGDRAGPHTSTAIWTGRGFVDNVRAVGRGRVDMALTTPAAFARMALDGRGPYAGEAYPDLRAIGTVPQDDRLVLAVAADQGVASFAELRERRAPLRLATARDDGVNHVGYAVARLMERAGVPRATLEAWGGAYLEDERPFPPLRWVQEGRADAIMQEAVMTPQWQELARTRRLRFIPIEDEVLASLERDFGWPRAELPAGYFPGLEQPLPTLDFSDFLLLVRADLPDDVAHLLAWCLVSTRDALEAQYRHLPPERSPVTYPLEPRTLATAAIPLHPGAARCYREAGVLP